MFEDSYHSISSVSIAIIYVNYLKKETENRPNVIKLVIPAGLFDDKS